MCKSDNFKNRRKFREEAVLENFVEHLELIKQDIPEGNSLILYRTQESIPVDEYGQTPNGLRKRNGIGRRIGKLYSFEEISEMSFNERTAAVGKFGLSCNSSEEAAEASFLNGLKKLIDKKASKLEIDEYVLKRGTYICRYIMSREHGIITKFNNEHANIYLYDGVNLEDFRDKEFLPREIDFLSYVEEQ